jgi:uncharacterized protein (UPF0332 family)
VKLDQEDKRAISDLRMERAREFLSDAQALLLEGRFRSSVNRSYYAALSGLRSLLILEGADPQSHEGAVTLLSLRFVRTGLLPADVIKQFRVLLSRRTDVDYGDFDAIDENEAKDSLDLSGRVLQYVDILRIKLIGELKSH